MYEDMFSLMSPLDAVDITLRGAIQTIDTNNHRDDVGVRVVERGQFKKFTPGTMQQGKAMDATLDAGNHLHSGGVRQGKEKLLLNKLTGEYRVNGVDIMSKVRSLT